MKLLFIEFFFLSIIHSCHENNLVTNSKSATYCLNDLATYADTFRIRNSSEFKLITLPNTLQYCEFDKYIENESSNLPVIKIVLKLNEFAIKNNFGEVDLNGFYSNSTFSKFIVEKYNYIYLGRRYNPLISEQVFISSIKGFLKYNKKYLIDNKVNYYFQNLK